jgi:hypothetical protein
MTHPPPDIAVLRLEVEVGSEPIRGVLVADGRPAPFSGWMELAAVLDAAHSGEGIRASPSEPHSAA